MLKRLNIPLLAMLLAASAHLGAEVPDDEIFVDVEDGVPSFSDRSTDESEKIEIQPPMLFESEKLAPRDMRRKDEEPPESAPLKYTLEITNPADDSAIRDNAGNLTLTVQVNPDPVSGHSAELLMDGTPVRTLSKSGDVTLTNVDRGTHQFQIRVSDDSGKVVASSPVSRISMLRHFIRPGS